MRRGNAFGPAVAVLVLAFGGCSQAPAPETSAPATAPAAEPAPPTVQEAKGNEAETEHKDATARGGEVRIEAVPRDPTVIPVGSREQEPRTLWEAAVAARKQRATGPGPRISVTDENLHEFQDADLTVAAPRKPSSDGANAAEEGSGAEPEEAHGEEYWRSTVLDLRLRLRTATDELAELEGRAAELRRSFYAQDDPYVRDAEIKPAWDRALDRVGELRREILDLYRELEDTLEEGRRAGALPGWLREGIELEPEPEELPRPREGAHEPGEPEVMEIEGQIEEPPER